MLGGADNPNGELPSYITGADKCYYLSLSPYSLPDNIILHPHTDVLAGLLVYPSS